MKDNEEKVLKGLECCADRTGKLCKHRPYDFANNDNCMGDMARDALNLLKEQQEQPEQKHGHWVSVPDRSPKTTTINMYSFICSCSECGKAVGHHAEYNYCPGCGAIMTWMVNQDES